MAFTARLQAKRPRSPSEVEDEDEPCSKETLCGTPFSQASTAPCTPIRFFLPDPFEVVPQPSFCVSPSKYMPRSQQAFAVLEFVEKHECQVVDNVKLMEDCCEKHLHMQEPTEDGEDEDVDEEDEWMKIDELYIPAELEGMCVLTKNPDSVGMPGHALTPEGRLIDLNGGGPVVFSCQPGCSSGNDPKVDAIRTAKASHLAKLAADVDDEILCSIDGTGTVRGNFPGVAIAGAGWTVVLQSPSAAASSAQSTRLKHLYWKRSRRQAAPTSCGFAQHPPVMSVGACGRVFLFSVKKSRRREARMVVHRGVNVPLIIMSIDAMGVVCQVAEDFNSLQDIEECFTEGTLRKNSDAQRDANGVSRDHDHIFVGL